MAKLNGLTHPQWWPDPVLHPPLTAVGMKLERSGHCHPHRGLHTHTHTGYNQISSSGLNFTQAIRLVSTLPVVPLKFCSWQLDGWKFFSGDSVWIEIQLLFLVGVEIFLLQELGDSLTEKEDLLRDSLLGALAGFGCGPGEEDLRFHPMFNLSLSLKRQVTLKKN